MRKVCAALLFLFMAAAMLSGQDMDWYRIKKKKGMNFGSASVTGDWSWYQDATSSISANGGNFGIQGACGASPGTGCTWSILPTQAGSVRLLGIITTPGTAIYISSAYDCAVSSGCTSGNALDTFTISGTHAWAHDGTNDNQDLAYAVNGASGATYVTVNFSGTPSSSVGPYVDFLEGLPPTCGGSPCTNAFDGYVWNGESNDSCGSGCTGSALTVTATDMIFGLMDSSNTVGNFVAPYSIDPPGNMFGINSTTGPAYQITTGGWYALSEMSFKLTYGTFTVPSAPFTYANGPTPPSNTWLPTAVTTSTCNPSCTLTLPATTPSGDLLMLIAAPQPGNTGVISSVSSGGTWVVPTGANTCQNTSVIGMSCAYTLSSSSGATTLSVTMSANASYQFSYTDIHRTSGSFSLSGQNSVSNSSSLTTITAPSLTVTGPAVCFGEVSWVGTGAPYIINNSVYPYPGGQDAFQGTGTEPFPVVMMGLNLISGTYAPQTELSAAASTKSAATHICFN
jgi:hypothetical protein